MTEHRAAYYRVQGGFFPIFNEFYRLLLWSESGVCRRRLTDVLRRWRRRVISSCFPRFCGSGAEEEQRRCGSAGWRGSRWFSPVWWMTHLARGSREGKQTDLVVTVQELVHGAPSPEFYTRVSSNRKKTPQRELKRTCRQTGVRFVFILSFLALCSEAASTSCVCDPFSFLGFLDPLPVSDERLGLCLCTSSFDTTAFN